VLKIFESRALSFTKLTACMTRDMMSDLRVWLSPSSPRQCLTKPGIPDLLHANIERAL
jgi:hypothetical protein